MKTRLGYGLSTALTHVDDHETGDPPAPDKRRRRRLKRETKAIGVRWARRTARETLRVDRDGDLEALESAHK